MSLLQQRVRACPTQRGQILPLVAVMLIVLTATLYFMFNTGVMVQEKMRLDNAVDGAAYAGGVRTARVLNYYSYINRSMIANETAIGQMVGLASWMEHAYRGGQTLSENGGELMHIPGIGQTLAEAAAISPDRRLEHIRDMQQMAMAFDLSLWWFLEKQALDTYRDSSWDGVYGEDSAQRYYVMKETLRLNYDDKPLLPGSKEEAHYIAHLAEPLEDNWQEMTALYSSREQRQRMGGLISAERDDFSVNRDRDFGAVVTAGGSVELIRRGRTELVDDADGWAAIDSGALHRDGVEAESIGWGSAFTNNKAIQSLTEGGMVFAENDALLDNPATNALAMASPYPGFGPLMRGTPAPMPDFIAALMRQSANNGNLVGRVPRFVELSESALAQDDPIIRTTIRNYRAFTALNTTEDQSKVGHPMSVMLKKTAKLDLYQGNAVENVETEIPSFASVASFEVYFARSVARDDGAIEKGSVFNPYWRPRLIETTDEMRHKAQQQMGSPVFTPVDSGNGKGPIFPG